MSLLAEALVQTDELLTPVLKEVWASMLFSKGKTSKILNLVSYFADAGVIIARHPKALKRVFEPVEGDEQAWVSGTFWRRKSNPVEVYELIADRNSFLRYDLCSRVVMQNLRPNGNVTAGNLKLKNDIRRAALCVYDALSSVFHTTPESDEVLDKARGKYIRIVNTLSAHFKSTPEIRAALWKAQMLLKEGARDSPRLRWVGAWAAFRVALFNAPMLQDTEFSAHKQGTTVEVLVDGEIQLLSLAEALAHPKTDPNKVLAALHNFAQSNGFDEGEDFFFLDRADTDDVRKGAAITAGQVDILVDNMNKLLQKLDAEPFTLSVPAISRIRDAAITKPRIGDTLQRRGAERVVLAGGNRFATLGRPEVRRLANKLSVL